MKKVKKLGALKVNTGSFRVTRETPADQRMPRADMLQKAKLWQDESFGWVRDILIAPPLHVEISEVDESLKVSTTANNIVYVLRPEAPMSRAISALPTTLMLVDVRGVQLDEVGLMRRIPGRDKFADMVIVVIGGLQQADAAKQVFSQMIADDWVGEVRTCDVFTDTPNNAYTATRRRLHIIIPSGRNQSRVVPFYNICDAPDLLTGWVSVVGLLKSIWSCTGDTEGGPHVDWMYVVSDDVNLPVALVSKIIPHPNVVFYPFEIRDPLADVAAKVSDGLNAEHETPPLPWLDLLKRSVLLQPLYDPDVQEIEPPAARDEGEASGASDVDEEAPASKPKARPAPKQRAKPRTPPPEREPGVDAGSTGSAEASSTTRAGSESRPPPPKRSAAEPRKGAASRPKASQETPRKKPKTAAEPPQLVNPRTGATPARAPATSTELSARLQPFQRK